MSVAQIIQRTADNAVHCTKQSLQDYLQENWQNITEHENQPIDIISVSSADSGAHKKPIDLLSSSSQEVILLSKK